MADSNAYVFGLDLISVTDRTGAQTYFAYDGLGSTANLTNGSGNTTASYSYDVFGALRSPEPSATNEFRFTGEQRDSQAGRNLYYLRARYYDPGTGRFLSQDPVMAGHAYAYVENNPVNLVDPSGLDGCKAFDFLCRVGAHCRIPFSSSCEDAVEQISDPIPETTLFTVNDHHVTLDMLLVCIRYRIDCRGGPTDLGVQAAKATVRRGDPCSITPDCEGTPEAPNELDRFEHCYWSGLLTLNYGAGFAKDYLTAYEAWPDNPRLQRVYDLNSNSLGRDLARGLPNSPGGEAVLRRACKE